MTDGTVKFCVEKLFPNIETLENKIKRWQRANHVQLYRLDSRSVAAVEARNPKKLKGRQWSGIDTFS